jgi:hypothetical protein
MLQKCRHAVDERHADKVQTCRRVADMLLTMRHHASEGIKHAEVKRTADVCGHAAEVQVC